jgi:hypothetical protein
LKAKNKNLYYLTVSLTGESEDGLSGCLWLRISPEGSSTPLTRAVVFLSHDWDGSICF